MDNIKLILVMTWLFLLLLLYQAWQDDYGPKPVGNVATSQTTATPNTPANGEAGAVPAANSQELPTAVATQAQGGALPGGDNRLLQSGERIRVKTDVFQAEIDTLGGDLRVVDLPAYPVSVDKPDEPFRLLDDQSYQLFVLQSGLLAGEQGPNHQAQFRAEQSEYTLADGADSVEVKLYWEHNGVNVTKIYRFHRDSYIIDLEHRVENSGGEAWNGHLYAQLQRAQTSDPNQSQFIYTYLGGAIASPQSLYEKITFDDIQETGPGGQNVNINPDGTLSTQAQSGWAGGWLAVLQHYFVAAVVPAKEQNFNYYGKYLSNGNRYMLGLVGGAEAVGAGETRQFALQVFAGPKQQHVLGELSPGLELTVDYGFLWFIAQPLYWMLELIHSLIGNWGWAIIILTILIKLAFFHLSATSYRSMANMRRLQPRLAALKDRYANDKAGLNQAMMDMYKKEKINPLGGCLPILIQIPVFIALYWTLLESVELRQASFILWLNDLSQPDPYFVLPLIMGATMLIQHYLNPAPLDPLQQKIMMMLPIVFTVFFAFFPAGLVLYWVVNNVLSIAQQWYITRQIAPDTLPSSGK